MAGIRKAGSGKPGVKKTKAKRAKSARSKTGASKAGASKAGASKKGASKTGRSRSQARPAGLLRVHVEHDPTTDESQLVTEARFREAAKRFPGLLSRIRVSYGFDPAKFDATVADANVLVAVGYFDLTNLRARAPKLQWVQSTSAGVEKLTPSIPRGVTLTNASGVHAPRGGEYGMTAVLMLNSRVPAFVTNQKTARWTQIYTTPVAGKTVVILGTGSIGGETARLAKRFGMRVLGISRSGRPHRHFDRTFGPGQLRKVLPEADFVVVALPHTPETRGMLGRAELDLLQHGAGIVNVGRARVVDYEALVEKLRKGELSGAVLDVFYEEPLPPKSPMWSVPNLIVTPHCAVDDESVYVARCLDIFFDNLRRFLARRPLRNVVDTKLGY
jgi:phosphoglycerate dehydrogenase-like enzyme